MNANAFISSLFPGFQVDEITVEAKSMIVTAHATSRVTICPNCYQPSERVHSYYTRRPLDLPLAHFAVQLQLQVRRFRCLNMHCVKQTFAERIPEWLPVYARRTSRLNESLYHLAQMLGGKGGERLSNHLHVTTGYYTLLRLIRQREIISDTTPRVIGVDDWAMRKGRTYGTIIVDLETHRVIDLLSDRTADTLAAWLQETDNIEVVARDRSTDYAAGITMGAPEAMQVADRWHLLQNLSQLVEKWLNRNYARLKKLPIQIDILANETERPPYIRTRGEELKSQISRQRRQERYAEIQRRKKAGESISQIARALAIHRETVRTYYYAERFPERQRRGKTASLLDPYAPYLEQRQIEGCENSWQLWREIQAMGYPGKACQVTKWLQPRRTRPAPQAAKNRRSGVQAARVKLPAVRQIVWLLTTPSEKLLTVDKAWVEHLYQDNELSRVYQFAQTFSTMVREHEASGFGKLVNDGLASSIRELRNFAKGLQIDGSAVMAALQTQWSNGQTEGQVTRLKLLKRQMYGRAKLDLLRYRLMYQP